MKQETEDFLTGEGLWNYADNIKLSRKAELLEKYAQSRQADVSGSLPAQECEHDFIIVATNFNNPTEKYLTSVLLECSKCDKRIAGRRQ